jgi:hypothetical protein
MTDVTTIREDTGFILLFQTRIVGAEKGLKRRRPGFKTWVGVEIRHYWFRDSPEGLATRWRYFFFAAMIM